MRCITLKTRAVCISVTRAVTNLVHLRWGGGPLLSGPQHAPWHQHTLPIDSSSYDHRIMVAKMPDLIRNDFDVFVLFIENSSSWKIL